MHKMVMAVGVKVSEHYNIERSGPYSGIQVHQEDADKNLQVDIDAASAAAQNAVLARTRPLDDSKSEW